MKKKITIGSRGSKLAILYAQKVKDKIIQSTSLKEEEVYIKSISTKGDQIKDTRLSDVGGKGLFSSEIEKQLLKKAINMLADNGILVYSNCSMEKEEGELYLCALREAPVANKTLFTLKGVWAPPHLLFLEMIFC